MEIEVIWIKIKKHWSSVVIMLCVIAFFWALAGIEPTRYDHPFKQGDIVCMKITNEKAQVIESSITQEPIQIRIAITSSIASDGSTTTARKYSTMWVDDFEVEDCKGN